MASLSVVNEQNRATKHIALVGVTGVGKSTHADRYDIEHQGVGYTLWDTRGLNEGSEQAAAGPLIRFLRFLWRSSDTDNELRKFLRGKNPQIDLILFCIEAEKIRVKAQWKNYDKINKFCKRKIRVGVVVTRMDWNCRSTDWKRTCEHVAREVVRGSLDARLIEAMPVFERIEDTVDCRSRILRLITNFA